MTSLQACQRATTLNLKKKKKQAKNTWKRNQATYCLFVLHRYRAKEYIIPNDACLTYCCLSVIDKSWEHRYLNVTLGCFSPIRITVWSGFAGWNHMKTNLQAWVAHKLQRHISALPFLRRCRSYPNPSVLSMQITCRWVDIHYSARLWLDMKLPCCLHQLWLRGLSGLCSNVVWEWRRYSNKAIWVNWPESNILYLCPPLLIDTDISITPHSLCWTPATIKAREITQAIIC